MPKTLRTRCIAAEDKGFYEHPGIDPIGIARAAWTDLVAGGVVQGGSTITQQLVKNVYAGEYVEDPKTGEETYIVPPRNISQKVREALLAVKVEQEFSEGRDPGEVSQHRVLRSRRLWGPGRRSDVLAEGRE